MSLFMDDFGNRASRRLQR